MVALQPVVPDIWARTWPPLPIVMPVPVVVSELVLVTEVTQVAPSGPSRCTVREPVP